MIRCGTKARIERQKRALARLQVVPQSSWETACWPQTNIKRFRDEDHYADYYARKLTERSSLRVSLHHVD